MTLPSPRELLRQRQRDGSARGQRTDEFHLAMVLEGGGMRGVVSIGMATAFEDRGLLAAFDSVHGSSAGACAGAYFATGQAKLGARIYYEDINNSTFINPRRLLVGRAAMNKDFLIDDVMRTRKPLDVDRLLALPNFLHIVVTNASSGEGRVHNAFRDGETFFRVLKASICIPIVAGPAVELDGERYIDGGMVQQIALRSALEAGATHIIVLMTRRANELERSANSLSFRLEECALRLVYGKRLAAAYSQRHVSINEALREIAGGQLSGGGRVDMIVRPPSDEPDVQRLTTDRDALIKACADARAASLAYLDA